jgi:hypothetical protein
MKLPNSKYMLVNIRVAVLRPRIRNFVEDVVDNYSEEEFRENFRMYRTTFNHILDLVLDLNVEDIEDENGEEFNEDIIMERDRLRMGQQKRNYICNNLLQYSFYKLYIFIKEDLVRTKNILNI